MEVFDKEGAVTFETNRSKGRFFITDTGSGIAEAGIALLFLSFFSTRKAGQGIGFTLIREILSGHGFPFSLKTADKGKTVFWLEVR